MNVSDFLSYVVVGSALVAIYLQLGALRHAPKLSRVLLFVALWYFVVVYAMALLTTDVYLIRSGILTRLGVIFLLAGLMVNARERC